MIDCSFSTVANETLGTDGLARSRREIHAGLRRQLPQVRHPDRTENKHEQQKGPTSHRSGFL